MQKKPILFSGPMIRAILEGRKTQTRRALNRDKLYNGFAFDDPRVARACPYGQAGDRLWVRETWTMHENDKGADCVLYRADVPNPEMYGPWRPSIFMPRNLSRITLEITGVRVERLQDISEDDAVAEGVEKNWLGPDPCPPEYADEWLNYGTGEDDFPCFSAVDSFKSLWDSINGKRGYGWDSNPYVWVIEFRVISD